MVKCQADRSWSAAANRAKIEIIAGEIAREESRHDATRRDGPKREHRASDIKINWTFR